MQFPDSDTAWDFSHIIGLLHTLAPHQTREDDGASATRAVFLPRSKPPTPPSDTGSGPGGLGNFSKLYDFLSIGRIEGFENKTDIKVAELSSSLEKEKVVKWRDENDGADLEDNIEPEAITAASLRTKARAERRAKAKRKKAESEAQAAPDGSIERPPVETDTGSGESDSGNAPSPSQAAASRRAVIQSLLYPTKAIQAVEPPKDTPRKVINNVNRDWPVSEPFLYTPVSHKSYKQDVHPLDNLTSEARRYGLLQKLETHFPEERKYLMNQGVGNYAFNAHNVASEGIHVFVDISNVSFFLLRTCGVHL